MFSISNNDLLVCNSLLNKLFTFKAGDAPGFTPDLFKTKYSSVFIYTYLPYGDAYSTNNNSPKEG